jgi:hypothetical protein
MALSINKERLGREKDPSSVGMTGREEPSAKAKGKSGKAAADEAIPFHGKLGAGRSCGYRDPANRQPPAASLQRCLCEEAAADEAIPK